MPGSANPALSANAADAARPPIAAADSVPSGRRAPDADSTSPIADAQTSTTSGANDSVADRPYVASPGTSSGTAAQAEKVTAAIVSSRNARCPAGPSGPSANRSPAS